MVFKTIKRAALRLFVCAFLLIGCVLIIQACTNSRFREDVEDITALVKGQLYRGVSVEQDATHGKYLSFESMDDAKAILKYLYSKNDEERISWEKGIKFSSLRIAESNYTDATVPTYQYPTGVREYPDRSMSTILNPSGYVKIASKLYQDTNIGDMVYVYEDNQKKVYRDASVRDKALICHRGDDDKSQVGNYSGLIPTAKVRGYIDHFTNWISGWEWLTLYTYYYNQASNGAGGWYEATAGSIGVTYSYNIIVNGGALVGNNLTAYFSNKKSMSVQISSTSGDICINSVSGQHKAGGLWVNTYSAP